MAVDLPSTAAVIGAGPIGCTLATFLARRGLDVTLFEKRPDLRQLQDPEEGRSINLVLTRRGLLPLAKLGLADDVLALTVPVRGRMMHLPDGPATFQPYGIADDESNHAVARNALNARLLSAAEDAGVHIQFRHRLMDYDLDAQTLRFKSPQGPVAVTVPLVFGCDGAPSRLRRALCDQTAMEASSSLMDWGYREIRFPPIADGDFALAPDALHIWPRGDHFLMALANRDRSMTGTLYLAKQGPLSFESLHTPDRVQDFFRTHYPGAEPLLGDYVEPFLGHPTGILGTVRTAPWYVDDRALLLGDAAHAIVPFFGQGLNCGLQDCLLLDQCLDQATSLQAAFQRFYEHQKPAADAIADLALENATEMGQRVADADFRLQKAVENRLERAFPDLYRSRYALVMYSHHGYHKAQELGRHNRRLLQRLCDPIDHADELDLHQARHHITTSITPVVERLGIELPLSKHRVHPTPSPQSSAQDMRPHVTK